MIHKTPAKIGDYNKSLFSDDPLQTFINYFQKTDDETRESTGFWGPFLSIIGLILSLLILIFCNKKDSDVVLFVACICAFFLTTFWGVTAGLTDHNSQVLCNVLGSIWGIVALYFAFRALSGNSHKLIKIAIIVCSFIALFIGAGGIYY